MPTQASAAPAQKIPRRLSIIPAPTTHAPNPTSFRTAFSGDTCNTNATKSINWHPILLKVCIASVY